jgi:hypothetical protein
MNERVVSSGGDRVGWVGASETCVRAANQPRLMCPSVLFVYIHIPATQHLSTFATALAQT